MNKDELPELPVAEAWRVKGHYTEIFVDFGEANKYALAIGAKVEPLIVRDECREYALATMQAGEPVAYMWIEGGKRLNGSEYEAWQETVFSLEKPDGEPYCLTSLFARPQATSEAEAMLAYAAENGWPMSIGYGDGKPLRWVYPGQSIEGYATPQDAIRAAMKGAGS